MSILNSAEVLLQAKNYSGSGNWLDEANSHDAVPTGAPPYTSDGQESFFTLNGTDEYFTIADSANLDIEAAEDFTAMIVAKSSTAASLDVLLAKKSSNASTNAGWVIYWGANDKAYGYTADGTNETFDISTVSLGATKFSAGFVRNVSDDDVEVFVSGVGTGTPTTDATTLTLANALDVLIGRYSGAANDFPGDVYAVAIWTKALTDDEMVEADNLLQNGSGDRFLLLGVP